MSTPTPDEQDRELTLGHLSKADLLALLKRMLQLYPDLTGLIEPVQQTTPPQRAQRPPFNPEFYRHQVNEVFRTTDRNTWGSEARAANPLLDIVDIADEYGEQQDFNNAATLYEIIIRGDTIISNPKLFCGKIYLAALILVVISNRSLQNGLRHGQKR